MSLSTLETNILLSKGLSQEQLTHFAERGIQSRADFATVGDAQTLADLMALPLQVAEKVMAWALRAGAPASRETGDAPPGPTIVQSADVLFCVHCNAKQPKDYKAGDLCLNCGKQAEPVLSCFWCGANGPGKFCRVCGAQFVPTGELELAVLLRYEGLPKNEIPERLSLMSAADKDVLWGRVRRARTGRS